MHKTLSLINKELNEFYLLNTFSTGTSVFMLTCDIDIDKKST
jgi:hypothetical protein